MHFILEGQAQDLSFIKDILTRNIGKIKTIVRCPQACNTFAYLIDDSIIVKFPKDLEKLKKIENENASLSFLRGQVTIKIPETILYKEDFVFSCHRLIRGQPLFQRQYDLLDLEKQQTFCKEIARFIYELHSLTPQIRKAIDIPLLRGIGRYYSASKIKEILSSDKRMTGKQIGFISKFEDEGVNPFEQSEKVSGHFDIQPKNIAFDFVKNEIAGIYDFGDCGLCAREYDFIKVGVQYNQKTVFGVISEYEKISGIKTDRQAVYRYALYDILYCLAKDVECGRSIDAGLDSLNLKMEENAFLF